MARVMPVLMYTTAVSHTAQPPRGSLGLTFSSSFPRPCAAPVPSYPAQKESPAEHVGPIPTGTLWARRWPPRRRPRWRLPPRTAGEGGRLAGGGCRWWPTSSCSPFGALLFGCPSRVLSTSAATSRRSWPWSGVATAEVLAHEGLLQGLVERGSGRRWLRPRGPSSNGPRPLRRCRTLQRTSTAYTSLANSTSQVRASLRH